MTSGMGCSLLGTGWLRHAPQAVTACLKIAFRLSELVGSVQGSKKMRRLVFAIGILALGLAATTAARADYAVVMFKDGHCRAWNETGNPMQPGWKYHWVHLKSWDFAVTKKHYAMTHHWCKSFG